MHRPFKPYTGTKKTYTTRDDHTAPASMRQVTSGAWSKGQTLTDRQKKRVRI